jgi:hypothetical protein
VRLISFCLGIPVVDEDDDDDEEEEDDEEEDTPANVTGNPISPSSYRLGPVKGHRDRFHWNFATDRTPDPGVTSAPVLVLIVVVVLLLLAVAVAVAVAGLGVNPITEKENRKQKCIESIFPSEAFAAALLERFALFLPLSVHTNAKAALRSSFPPFHHSLSFAIPRLCY